MKILINFFYIVFFFLCGCSEINNCSLSGQVISGSNLPIAGSKVSLYKSVESQKSNAVLIGNAQTDNAGHFNLTFSPPSSGSFVYAIASGGKAAGGDNINFISVLGPFTSNFPKYVTLNEMSTVITGQVYGKEWSKIFSNGKIIPLLIQNVANNKNLEFRNQTINQLLNLSHGTLTEDASSNYFAKLTENQVNFLSSCVRYNSCAIFQKQLNISNSDTFSLLMGIRDSTDKGLNQISNALKERNVNLLYPDQYNITNYLAFYYDNLPPAINLTFKFSFAVDQNENVWIPNSQGVTEMISKNNYINPITFTGFPEASWRNLTIDSVGNIWILNSDVSGSGTGGSIIEMTANSDYKTTKVFEGESYDMMQSLAITSDIFRNIWVADQGRMGSILKMTSENNYLGTHFAVPLSPAIAITTDLYGNVWVANRAYDGGEAPSTLGSVMEMVANKNYSFVNFQKGAYDFNDPSDITTDIKGNIWVADSDGHVTEMIANKDYSGKTFSNKAYDSNTLTGIATDKEGNVWVTNSNSDPEFLDLYNKGGSIIKMIASKGYSGINFPDKQTPVAITVDNTGNVWVLNASYENSNNKLNLNIIQIYS